MIEWLVATFLLAPLMGALSDALADAPARLASDALSCASAAGPALVQRALEDPWWAIWTALGAWLGLATPDAAIRAAAPSCAAALDAVKPYLD